MSRFSIPLAFFLVACGGSYGEAEVAGTVAGVDFSEIQAVYSGGRYLMLFTDKVDCVDTWWKRQSYPSDPDNVFDGGLETNAADRESADWPVFLEPDADFRLAFDFGGASVDPTRLRAFDPTTGDVYDLPLSSTGPNTAELVVTLDAGDVLLFKYATGLPFAMRR